MFLQISVTTQLLEKIACEKSELDIEVLACLTMAKKLSRRFRDCYSITVSFLLLGLALSFFYVFESRIIIRRAHSGWGPVLQARGSWIQIPMT
jgi:hypothetical protein